MFRLTQSEWETFKRRHEPEVFTKAMMEGWIEDIKEDLMKAESGEQLDEPTTNLVNNFKEELQSFQKVTVIRNAEENSLSKGLIYEEYYIRPQQVEWIENDITKSETGEIEKSRYGKYKNTELNRKLGRVGVEFGKAIEVDIEKGKSANIGDVHTWNGKQFKKQGNGKWLEVSEHGLTRVEHTKEYAIMQKKPQTNRKLNDILSGKVEEKNTEMSYEEIQNKVKEREEKEKMHMDNYRKLSDKEHSDEEVGLEDHLGIKPETYQKMKQELKNLSKKYNKKGVQSIFENRFQSVSLKKIKAFIDKEYELKQSSEKKDSNIEVGQTYHAPATDGGEAIDFTITSIKDERYTIETSNKEGRKGEHTFDEDTLRDLISESKLKNKSK